MQALQDNSFESQYRYLVQKILAQGQLREGRNGATYGLFGESLTFDISEGFPLLTGRRIFYKGVFGELAALLRKPKTIADFEAQGCFYWKLWAKPDGSINVDYGNKWLDWDGVDQLARLVHTLKTNPSDRRLIISGWDPTNIDNLDLPCCHYAYQWYVRDGKLDMLWHQRSADTMIGLPSDAVFAAAWNIAIANEVGLEPGRVTMTLGDTHIYAEHAETAREYLKTPFHWPVKYKLHSNPGKATVKFTPQDIEILDYNPVANIKFELKS